MDGAHDMGGVKGFGPVVPEPNEPVFHGEWERRAFALTVAMARPGGWNPGAGHGVSRAGVFLERDHGSGVAAAEPGCRSGRSTGI